jgi:hypothetical protein
LGNQSVIVPEYGQWIERKKSDSGVIKGLQQTEWPEFVTLCEHVVLALGEADKTLFEVKHGLFATQSAGSVLQMSLEGASCPQCQDSLQIVLDAAKFQI